MPSLSGALSSAPVPLNLDRARSALDGIDATAGTPWHDLLLGTAGASNYLARLIGKHDVWLNTVAQDDPKETLQTLLEEMQTAIQPDTPRAEVARALRIAKTRAALLIALADLGGIWTLMEVTGALTRLADTCTETASQWLLAQEIARDRLPGMTQDALNTGAGYSLLAMGKMGAGELNYSSDVDLIALFDETQFTRDDALEARARYIHVTRQLVQLLSENTADGYAFRTDLRLRPSPSTTPVCMAMGAAEAYYESVGRTWERAAHIKARPLVDTGAGARYLAMLTPFVWRRHLDFATIEDTHEMLRKIRAQKAQFTTDHLPGQDLKLGPGGIREIEFFAQTRQLIVGGRDPALRVSTTLGALEALEGAGWIASDVCKQLSIDYVELRTTEHRLQMLEDAQTHTVPTSVEARLHLAALNGTDDLAAFEKDLVARLTRVHAMTEEFYAPVAKPAHAPSAEHVTEASLAEAGFTRPGDALRQIERWDAGGIAATRSDRAREIFLRLQPQILSRLSGAADPDQALIHFDRFLSGLPAGVQVFSLFSANPNLLDLIVEICAAAPRLALYLGRRPQTLDALVEMDFWSPLPDRDVLEVDLTARLALENDYEDVLDAARRWAREQWFRAGVHTLRGTIDHRGAGQAFTSIAAASISGLMPHVIRQFSERHGPPPGNGMAVLAMGKLGSGEMTAGSDLDLIIVYDAAGETESTGRKPLTPSAYYPRLTQALVAALTAPTAEGALYEVDMRLRPSGKKGPVAVSLAAFEQYQLNEAWVWEHLALTRASLITGTLALRDRIEAIIATSLGSRKQAPDVLSEAAKMRDRLADANATERKDPWSLKLAAGGIMEIEFTAQTGALLLGLAHGQPMPDQIEAFADGGWLGAEEADALMEALAVKLNRAAINSKPSGQKPKIAVVKECFFIETWWFFQ
ncbi:MAG: bifunctional [glutamine synthetase] adenylyltransferase/[glutamine synthetase]-adenylyl-L-tyrosine phosphorylase [Pseudomonadota bacterium]